MPSITCNMQDMVGASFTKCQGSWGGAKLCAWQLIESEGAFCDIYWGLLSCCKVGTIKWSLQVVPSTTLHFLCVRAASKPEEEELWTLAASCVVFCSSVNWQLVSLAKEILLHSPAGLWTKADALRHLPDRLACCQGQRHVNVDVSVPLQRPACWLTDSFGASLIIFMVAGQPHFFFSLEFFYSSCYPECRDGTNL